MQHDSGQELDNIFYLDLSMIKFISRPFRKRNDGLNLTKVGYEYKIRIQALYVSCYSLYLPLMNVLYCIASPFRQKGR